jgi:putative ABC transport system permease protein
MWFTYFKIACRILVRNRRFALINLVGLTLGLTSFIIIFGWLKDEFTFDRFHENRKRIVQLAIKHPDGTLDPNASYALAPRLAAAFPEIESYTTLMRMETRQQSAFTFYPDSLEPVRAYEPSVVRVDTSFFNIFDFPAVAGSRPGFLRGPGDVVISSRIASVYFPGIDPVGHSIRINNEQVLTVTGVVSIPANSFFRFDFFVPKLEDLSEDWNWRDPSYLLLKPTTDVAAFNAKIAGFFNDTYPNPLPGDFPIRLIPVYKAHLAFGGKGKVWMFSIVALLLVAVASLNYMNLATASYTRRIREAGIRRVMGEKRRQLMTHFFLESTILALAAMLAGLFLAELVMPAMSGLFGRTVEIGYLDHPVILLILLLIALLLGSLAALYPAVLFSRGNPVEVLHTNIQPVGRRSVFIVIAIVFQFTLSIALMISSLIVIKQVRYASRSDLGLSLENVVSIPLNQGIGANFFSFLERLKENPDVLEATAGQSSPYDEDFKTMVDWSTKDDPSDGLTRYSICLNNFPGLFGMELVSGRLFAEPYFADMDKFVINEAAAKMLGYEDPVGERLEMWGLDGEIIGVVRDFHHVSLHREILPHVINIHPNNYHFLRFIFIKLSGNNMPSAIAHIESLCRELAPDYPFSYSFLEEENGKLYSGDENLSIILGMFALLALVVSSLGIYGLAFYSAEKRSKDITMRKVFGADFGGIFAIFSKHMMIRIGLSLVLAIGLSMLVMTRWLQNFAYHIQPDPLVYLVPLVLALLVALSATLFAVWRLLRSSPAPYLKQE